MQLLCSDVDLVGGVLHYRAEITKSGEAGDIPIHPTLRPYLEEHARGDGLLLLRAKGKPWRPDEVSREFAKRVRQPKPEGLDWQDVTFHCLRHTFGTRLAASGKVTPFELQRLMRHKSITTSMLYVRKAQVKLPDVAVF